MEKLVSLCKRRGFVFQSSEIYGGLSSCWDYGPLGVELKNNVKSAWWQSVVRERDDMVGLDSSILMHPHIWVASGHVGTFADPLVDCKSCKQRFRADHLESDVCPECSGELTEARMFNLMFRTFMGPVEDDAAQVYMRPETAQGIFVNFQNVVNSTRKKLPFGIAQVGKAFRNEITPGNFTFRTREFEQMEIEYFVKPGTDEEWFQHWVQARFSWYTNLGIKPENLRLRPHDPDELAHYARGCTDVEYLFPIGWSELEGIANRTDFDLTQHADHSGQNLSYFDEQAKEHYIPYVIEPSAGADRATLAFLADAYAEELDEKEDLRVVLHFHPKLAPIKIAVLPLSRKETLIPLAKETIYFDLRKDFMVQYDDAQSIGKRYRRQDEIGTPFCVTVDFQSLEDNQVTVRDRDSQRQIRVPVEELKRCLSSKLTGEPFEVLPPGGSYQLGF
ncbi:MAG: glycine--tRNA ligase [Chloroflexota bacterium]|nr:glycine--tRNA ligase [Chloroflexota bacterium]